MLTHANLIATAESFVERRATSSRGDNWLCLPADGLGRRRRCSRSALSLVVGFTLQLPGEPGDRAARPARARAHRDAGAAAHLGEHADRGAGHGRPTPRRSSAACSSTSARVAERARAAASRRQAGAARRCGSAARSASSSSTARCATSSACARALVPTPAARRSGPTPSASSARSASTSSRSTAPPSRRRWSRCSPTPRPIPTRSGRPCPGIEVQIGDRGEVLVQGRRRLQGLLQAGRGDARGLDADGWLQTGDAGFIDPRGHLVIIDRAKDVGQARRRHALRAAVHREQAEVQPVHPRGGGVRRRAAVRGGDDRHRPAARSATGPSSRGLAYTCFMDLSQQARGRAA